jgi:hypothetical protein
MKMPKIPEMCDMDEAFEELAVIHGAHAGDDAEHSRCGWVGPTGGMRDEGLLIGLPGGEAGFAENLTSGGGADAAGAEGLAAVLAEGGGADTTVIYAVHFVLLSRTSNTEPPECAGRA